MKAFVHPPQRNACPCFNANLDGTFAAGERTGSVEYLIDNSNFTGYQQTILETVKNAAGQATKRTTYTYGLDEITQTVSLIDSGSQLITQSSTLTYGHDGHGSVRALFGAAAAIAQVFTYSAYGELLAIHNGAGTLQPLASSLTSVLYNGEGLDARTGLYNMRARWYSASNARWERLDPYSGNPNDPFSFNKYGFVHGDPVMGADPTGMFNMVSAMGSMAIAGLKMGLTSAALGAVFRGAFAGYALYNGQPVSVVLKELFSGIAQDFVFGALLGGGGNLAARLIASNAIKVRLLGTSISQLRWMRLPGSAWMLDRFARGLQIEKQILGRAASFMGQQLRNFPVIDDYILSGGRGIATSIKTLDLTRNSYQTVSNLKSTLTRYARSLSNFSGAARQGVQIGGPATPVTDRVLIVAFEEGAASAEQARALAQFASEFSQNFPNVRLLFQFVP
jgi:RHS repeat-associated protein